MEDFIFEYINSQTKQVAPKELFKLCRVSTKHNLICTEYRMYIWNSYFAQDIFPLIDNPDVKSNLITELQSNHPSAFYNDLYKNSILNIARDIWTTLGYNGKRIASTSDESKIDHKIMQLLHLANKAEIDIQNRYILSIALYAVRFAKSNLLQLVVQRWPKPFYFGFPVQSQGITDLTYSVLRELYNTLHRSDHSNDEKLNIVDCVIELFMIPNKNNPNGRKSITYSKQTQELLQSNNDHSSFGDMILIQYADWTQEKLTERARSKTKSRKF